MKLAPAMTMFAVGASIVLYTQSTPGWTFLGVGLFLLTLFVSIFIGVWLNSQIFLPILDNLPRSINHYLKHEVTFSAIPLQFVAPIVWCAGLFILGFVLQMFLPSVLRFFTTNLAVALGQGISLMVVFLSLVTPSGLRDLRADYDEKTYLRYRTPSNVKGSPVETIVRMTGNLYEQTKPSSAEAPTELRFELPDSTFRYLIFCLSAVEAACTGLIANPEVVIYECLGFLSGFSITKTGAELLGRSFSREYAQQTAPDYLESFRTQWVSYIEFDIDENYADGMDVICSMIRATESNEPVTEEDNQRLGPLALEIADWLPTIRSMFAESVVANV
jgi:hypothetical protein